MAEFNSCAKLMQNLPEATNALSNIIANGKSPLNEIPEVFARPVEDMAAFDAEVIRPQASTVTTGIFVEPPYVPDVTPLVLSPISIVLLEGLRTLMPFAVAAVIVSVSVLELGVIDVPLAEMFNYANAIRSLSQGRGTFSMEPSYYAQVPKNIEEKKLLDIESGEKPAPQELLISLSKFFKIDYEYDV